jgi:hypothetical protein
LAQLASAPPHRFDRLRGVTGRVGSVEWFAGVGFIAAMAAAFFAPACNWPVWWNR